MALMMLLCIVVGIIFSYVTLKSGNCMYAAIMHGIVNTIGEVPVFCSISLKSGLLGPNPTGILSIVRNPVKFMPESQFKDIGLKYNLG